MEVQIFEWTKLKSELSNIIISYDYQYLDLDGYLHAQITDIVLETKKVPSGYLWILSICDEKGTKPYNNYELKSWFSKIDNCIKKFQDEIDINLKLGLNEDLLLPYFNEIYSFLNDFSKKLFYNSKKQIWEFPSVKFIDEFEKHELFDSFKNGIQEFFMTLNNRLVTLALFLEVIELYQKGKNISKKSTSGNNKIEWKKQVNQLVDFYLNLLNHGLIETDRSNLGLFLINNFTYKGDSLSENTINTYIDPNKEFDKLPKGNKKINPEDFL
jgi:hypothetical protein